MQHQYVPNTEAASASEEWSARRQPQRPGRARSPGESKHAGLVRHPFLRSLSRQDAGSTFLLPLLTLLLVFALTACKKPESPGVLARVGDVTITVQDFNREVERLHRANRPVPNKQTLLEEMVRFESLLQRARQAKLDADPEVRRELSNLLIGKFLDRELEPRLKALEVSPAELQDAYQQNLTKYTRPAKVRLAILYIKTSPMMSETKQDEVNARFAEARQKAIDQPAPGGRGPAAQGFGAVAIQYSEDSASRYHGGDIGWLDADNFSYPWPREVLAAGYALDKGQVSQRIETKNGLYLVMKTDSRDASVTPFAQVEASLRQSLLRQNRQVAEAAFRAEAVRQSSVRINQNALAALEMPRPSTTNVAQNQETRPPELPGPPATPLR